MLFTLAVTAWPREPDARLHVLGMVATLGSTVTNGICGVLGIAVRYPRRRAVALVGLGIAVTMLTWAALHLVFPSLPFALLYSDWRRFILTPGSGGPVVISRALLVHAIVMPAITMELDPKWGVIMSVQHSPLGGTGWLATVATACWLALLAGGGAAVLRARPFKAFDRVLLGTLAAQVLLHLVFGEQTFLYTIHLAPLLVLVAARAALTPARLAALALAAVLVAAGGANNVARFRSAAGFLDNGRLLAATARTVSPVP